MRHEENSSDFPAEIGAFRNGRSSHRRTAIAKELNIPSSKVFEQTPRTGRHKVKELR
jgi:hypothetical protein